MKIHRNLPDSPYYIKSYQELEEGRISLKLHGPSHDSNYSQSFILHQDFLLALPEVQDLSQLNEAVIEKMAQRVPQILLIGTGKMQLMLQGESLQKFRSFIDKQIGIEIMKTEAAAKTYNILAQEGRDVMAILLLGPSS